MGTNSKKNLIKYIQIKQQKIAPYFFISPFYILFGIFLVYPLGYAIFLSFFDTKGTTSKIFVGLRNYLTFSQDQLFFTSFWNTTYYAIGGVFFILPFALVLATLLNVKFIKFNNFFRLTYFLPYLASGVVVAIMFILIYNQRYGMLNRVLEVFHLKPVHWLGREKVKISVILLCTWKYMGINILYFTVGLQSIPLEFYEVAQIDGANRWQQFLYITIPLLKPILFFTVVICLIGSFQLFAEPQVLAQGGPANASLSITMYLYRNGFQFLKLGYASAIGWSLALVIFFLSLLQFKIFDIFKER